MVKERGGPPRVAVPPRLFAAPPSRGILDATRPCPPRALRRGTLPALLCTVLLASLGARAPDGPTAPPPAAPTSPRPYLASVPIAFTQVSAGGHHGCARTVGGAVTCWGFDSEGRTAVPAGLVGVSDALGRGPADDRGAGSR